MYDKIFETYIHSKQDYNFYTFSSKTKYFINNVLKFIKPRANQLPLSIKYINITTQTNKLNTEINKLLSTTDVFVIGHLTSINMNHSIPDIPVYPIVSSKYVILTPQLFTQLNGIDVSNLIPNILYKIKHIIGGFLCSNNEISKIYEILDKQMLSLDISSLNIGLTQDHRITKLQSVRQFFYSNYHGWLSEDTQFNLKYAIQTYKPKNILELGSWLGKSAHYMKTLIPQSTLYCFDKFQNICHSPYKFEKYNPLDRFYLNFIRYETFWANMNTFSNVYTIREDAFRSLDMMKDKKIDMIYIDFIKSEKKLSNFLKKIFKLYPNTVIVGDDYVFTPVKKAIKQLLHTKNRYFGLLGESYIISPTPLPTEYHKDYEINKANISKKISVYNEIEELLERKEFTAAYKQIFNNKLQLNTNINELSLDNTVYHIIAINIRKHFGNISKDKLNILLKPVVQYEKPQAIYNTLLLTYKDYLEYNIDFK